MYKNKDDFFEALEQAGIKLDPHQKNKIIERIKTVTSYRPKVGIFGKTGVGKSSLANALFGIDVCKISDVASCTRKPQEVLVSLAGNNGLTLVDVPGVGESSNRDDEYRELYKNLMPELDLILWVLKGDDRAFTSDQNFYINVVKPELETGKPFFFVLNQVDKIEPFREWDLQKNEPGKNQNENINYKVSEVSRYFEVASSKVIPVSANERYGLVKLIDEIVFSLPPEKLAKFVQNVESSNVSSDAIEYVETKTSEYIMKGAASGATIGAKIAGPVGAVVGAIIGGAVGWISSWF